MSETVIVALITAGTSALVAITALLLNYRGFASIDARFASLESSVSGRFASLESTMNSRFASVEQRLNIMQTDLKEFYKVQAEHDKRISRLEG
jgi:hypothetical protein